MSGKVVGGQGVLGTFGGVFTPSILTILGLILFLRLGYVVGGAGLGQALVLILVAHSISVTTSISLAAIATNFRVKGGGVYYIISRTLGLPFGGAIGLVLFVAQSLSVGFYCIGFAEGVTALLGLEQRWAAQLIAAAAAAATVLLAWTGADWATRFQYLVMALLAGAILSFAAGAAGQWNPLLLQANFAAPAGWGGFWIMFAIFFPAVTGFTQGVGMSGDLADPARSIPRGTAWAVALSLLIYVAMAVACAATLPRHVLVSDYAAMKTVAVVAPLIDAGIIAATLSSALASLLGAPRILQSLAKDRVFLFLLPFAEGAGTTGNPRRGILLTGAIAAAVIALGNLNLIAGLVSMFFVATYGLLNYATYFEARGKSPSFRPSLRWYRPWISLSGALGALAVMLAIDLVAGGVAIVIVFALLYYLKRNMAAARWADGQRSYDLQIAREHLLAANARAEHPRDWRPQILAFSGDGERRQRLLTFAAWIEGRAGLTTAIRVIEGKGKQIRRARDQAEEDLAAELRRLGLRAFPLVVASRDLDAAVRVAVQTVGVGPTRINTVLVNWPGPQAEVADHHKMRQFASNLHSSIALGANVLILASETERWQGLVDAAATGPRTLDVWWRDNGTGRLMLVLAYLLTRNGLWERATIRVLAMAAPEAAEARRQHLEGVLRDVRIPSEVHIVAETDQPAEAIVEASAGASIVFLALAFRRAWFSDWRGNDLSALLPRLPLTVLTMAAQDIDLSADPDEGEEGERAAAKDAIDDALRRHDAAQDAVAAAQARIDAGAAGAPDDADRETDQAALAAAQAQLAEEAENLALLRRIGEDFGIAADEDEAPPAG